MRITEYAIMQMVCATWEPLIDYRKAGEVLQFCEEHGFDELTRVIEAGKFVRLRENIEEYKVAVNVKDDFNDALDAIKKTKETISDMMQSKRDEVHKLDNIEKEIDGRLFAHGA